MNFELITTREDFAQAIVDLVTEDNLQNRFAGVIPQKELDEAVKNNFDKLEQFDYIDQSHIDEQAQSHDEGYLLDSNPGDLAWFDGEVYCNFNCVWHWCETDQPEQDAYYSLEQLAYFALYNCVCSEFQKQQEAAKAAT